ncbi:MAG: hypothetical protein AB8G05_22865 [Oligoflexales bacterium]
MQTNFLRSNNRFTLSLLVLFSFYIHFASTAKANLFLINQSEEYNLLKNYLVDLKTWESQWSKISPNDQNKFSQTYYKEILELNDEINKQTQSLNKKLNLAFKNHKISKDSITQTPYNEVVRSGKIECGKIDGIDNNNWGMETAKFFSCNNCSGNANYNEQECFVISSWLTACTYPVIFLPIAVVSASIAQGTACLLSSPFRLKVTSRKTEKKISNPDIGKELNELINSLSFYLEQVKQSTDRETLSIISYDELREKVENIERVSTAPNQISIAGTNYNFTPEAIKTIKATIAKNQGRQNISIYRPKRMKTLNIEVDTADAVDFLFEIHQPSDSNLEDI